MTQGEWINKTVTQDMTYDGVIVNNYNIQPAIGGNVAGFNLTTGGYDDASKTGLYPAQAGVYAHEFGHALGLPDFYDTVYTSEGVGNYSMMAGGSWMRYPDNGAYSGNSPTHFDPFSKVFLGWAEPIEVKPTDGVKEITLPAINNATATDGKYELEKNLNRGDTGDFFKTGAKITPTSSNVHTGSYYFWKGYSATPADSGIHVTDIKENADGSITAKFYYSFSEAKK